MCTLCEAKEESLHFLGFRVSNQSDWASMFYLKEGGGQLAKSLEAPPNLCDAEEAVSSPPSSPVQLPHLPGCHPSLKEAEFGDLS